MCIGNVREGVDAAAAYRLHKQWVECNTDDCRLCWCMPICQAGCYANGNDDGALTDAAKRRACTLCRKWLHELLVTYCRILERNPNALDYVKTMTFS
jgi:sulfatase maturation enzyme AslB (radical SAM superfamily)